MRDVRSYLRCPNAYPTGRGVRVAIIDSGVDHTHPDVKEALLADKCRDCATGTNDWRDLTHHGTHLAGIVAGRGSESELDRCRGVAPDTEIIVFRVETGARLHELQLMRALDAAEDAGVDIINLSITFSPTDRQAPPWAWPPDSMLTDRLRELTEQGILCVVSAGNDGPDSGTVNFPGGAEEVLTVGAIDQDGEVFPKSSRGPFWIDPDLPEADYRTCGGIAETTLIAVRKPDLVVPGVDVWAPHSSHCARPDNTCHTRGNSSYVRESGTSQAAAVASGLAACALQILNERGPVARAQRAFVLRQLLLKAATMEPGSPDSHGAGILRWPALEQVVEEHLSAY